METIVKIWNKYIEPLYNWIPAGIQALWWRKHKKEGNECLAKLEELAISHTDVVDYFRNNGWTWQSDPLGGMLDFTSKLWVICAKQGGDCDDYAALWYHLLKPHGQVETLVTGKKWSFHKMTILTVHGISYLFSNYKLFRVVPETDKHKLTVAWYGDDTWVSVIY